MKFLKNIKRNSPKIVSVICLCFILISFAFNAFAKDQKELELELTWPTSPMGQSLTGTSDLGDLVRYLYQWGVSLGIIAVFLMIVYSGIEYLTSAGDTSKMKKALDRIKSAFLGAGLLLGSYLILNTINPQLTSFTVSIEDFGEIGKINFEEGENNKTCNIVKFYQETDFEGKEVITVDLDKEKIEYQGSFLISTYTGSYYEKRKDYVNGLTITEKMLENIKGANLNISSSKAFINSEELPNGGNCSLSIYGKSARTGILGFPTAADKEKCGSFLTEQGATTRLIELDLFDYRGGIGCIEVSRYESDTSNNSGGGGSTRGF